MPVTIIDPVPALVVIDLQKGMLSRPTAQPLSGIVSNAKRLADAFRKDALPVILVNVTGASSSRTEFSRPLGVLPPDFAELLPELNRQPSDHAISKRTPSAFTNTDLEEYLKGRRVTQIVLSGVTTSIGVESTGRQALELGFNVVYATDAMTDSDAEAHDNSIRKIFPRLGETAKTEEIIELLSRTA